MRVVAIIILFIVWLVTDLKLGNKVHRKNIKPMKDHFVRKSSIQFFAHGDKLFDHMLQRIENASDHIHIQFFIFRDDHIGQKFLDLLKEKAIEGVDVRLLVDWGGYHISRKEKKSLLKAGVQLAKTNTPSLPFLFYSINERNHRKVTVIDNQCGYIGGYNVGDEYLGRDPEMGRWRDYHLYIEGEACQDLQDQFTIDWNGSSGKPFNLKDLIPVTSGTGSTPVQIIPTDGAHVVEMIHHLLDQAKEFVFIGTPYFIPGDSLKKKLMQLSARGVDIKLLIPKYPDHALVKDAAFPYFPDLLKSGVDIRQFYEGFYHSKVLIIDEQWCDIGTSNFDKRSFHVNKEINCIIQDHSWIVPVREEIEKDFYESAEKITMDHIKNRSLFEKMKEKIATFISPFL
ncbi:cardiolipin synthase [Salipaludibacillus keqinensis]|uniref:Cardiolipin synthase n=1 Tax=Salipaludibacillus keqinensis TaxID=2045207 RepID=A0A323TQK2_9BACI|nr:cardiolipin synthase [Salipaludibacillus keqinensis]PYZ91585.1 cardiolipin synthase [Salipaludibacillus keqinensis]